MKLHLLDTQLVVWGGYEPERLSRAGRELIEDPVNELSFSSVTIWEIAIKQALGWSRFRADARVTRERLLENEYHEVPL